MPAVAVPWAVEPQAVAAVETPALRAVLVTRAAIRPRHARRFRSESERIYTSTREGGAP